MLCLFAADPGLCCLISAWRPSQRDGMELDRGNFQVFFGFQVQLSTMSTLPKPLHFLDISDLHHDFRRLK